MAIEGGVVQGGVSSAVHTVHIRASPDAGKDTEECRYTWSHTHTHIKQTLPLPE